MVKLISEIDLDDISSEEVFFVDTNVLLVVHFGSQRWSEEKIACYSNFILGLLNKGNKICVSALNLQELFHSVENNEFKQSIIITTEILQRKYIVPLKKKDNV